MRIDTDAYTHTRVWPQSDLPSGVFVLQEYFPLVSVYEEAPKNVLQNINK